MKLRFAPYWYDRFPQRRRPAYPRQRSNIESRVAIVGGGLTGCACASVLAAARIPVVLLEAERIGMGATGGAVGLAREDFELSFTRTTAAYGLRAARTLWQSMRRASLDFPAALRRLDIKCDLSPEDLLDIAPAGEPTRRARREYEARRQAGFDHSWATGAQLAREAGVTAGGGIRTRGAALDPYRACVGLAAAAAARGAAIFEHSPVRRLRSRRKGVDVVTMDGVVHADWVIVATTASIPDLRALRRHLHPRHGYAVITGQLPAAIRKQVGARSASLRDWSAPPHLLRWLKDDRALFAGADQPPVSSRLERQTLVQRSGQLMYELSLLYPAISGTQAEWGWSFGFDDTIDGLPYIGPHRNFPHHLFALGLGRHGESAAWLAARLLLRHIEEQPAKGDDLFGFARILRSH